MCDVTKYSLTQNILWQNGKYVIYAMITCYIIFLNFSERRCELSWL